MLQAVVTRLAQNSFTIKAWATTSCSALLALGAKDADGSYAALVLGPATVFWMLDAYYLWLERRYRERYESAAAILDPQMSMSLSPTGAPSTSFVRCMFSIAVAPLYLLLAGAGLVILRRLGAR